MKIQELIGLVNSHPDNFGDKYYQLKLENGDEGICEPYEETGVMTRIEEDKIAVYEVNYGSWGTPSLFEFDDVSNAIKRINEIMRYT